MAPVQDSCSVARGEPALTPLKATESKSMNMNSNTFLSRPTAFKIPPSPHASHFSPASPSPHTPFLPLHHHIAQQCMRHIAHLFKISSSSVYPSYITLPTSPNTFSSYPIALNFPSATSASAAPRPCHRPGFQPPPSTRPTSFPTHPIKESENIVHIDLYFHDAFQRSGSFS